MLVFNWGWIGIALACLVAGFVGGCEHNKHIIDAYEAAGKAQEAQTAFRSTNKSPQRLKMTTKIALLLSVLLTGCAHPVPASCPPPPKPPAVLMQDPPTLYLLNPAPKPRSNS